MRCAYGALQKKPFQNSISATRKQAFTEQQENASHPNKPARFFIEFLFKNVKTNQLVINRKPLILGLIAFVLFSLASCEKEEEEEVASTAEKIQAKWKMESWIIERHSDGTDSSWIIIDRDNDYFWDIQPGNSIYEWKGQAIIDTLQYTLQNNTTIIIRFGAVTDYTYTIKTLTESTLKIYAKDPFDDNPDNYYADTFSFTK